MRARSEGTKVETQRYIPSQWVSSDGSLPSNYDNRPNIAKAGVSEFVFESGNPPNSESEIYVLVSPNIYSSISAFMTKFVSDLQVCGYSVSVFALVWQNAASVRSLLQTGLAGGLEGAILVGNIPTVWYEMDNPSPWGHEEFPIDLYYMDLNGNWTDTDVDGKLDGHTGNVQPEIWVARIDASSITGAETQFVNNYFSKDHSYRLGNVTALRRALVYVDDDWAGSADYYNSNVQQVYSNTVLIKDNAITNATDYKNRLKSESYEWVHLMCHGSSAAHAFKIPGTPVLDPVYSSDYLSIDPQVLFYQFFVCSAARFTESNYLAGAAVFANNGGLVAIGSTKTGGLLYDNYFYNLLSQGKSIGETFKQWFISYGETDPKWFYGMTIIGDPTLRVGHLTLDVPDEFSTIQSAINAAFPGDAIHVFPGTYYENLVVNKSVSLFGMDAENTIIDGGLSGNVINITVARVQGRQAPNVNVSGFTIQRSGTGSGKNNGIYLSGGSYGSNITGNIITGNHYGIHLDASSSNSINMNNVTNNFCGIYLEQSSENSIFKNNAESNSIGVLLDWLSSENILKHNRMTLNVENFGVRNGQSISSYVNDVDSSNMADGKPIYYWVNRSDMTVPIDAGYVALINCTRITVQNLSLARNSEGVLVAHTKDSAITNNSITLNRDGIDIRYSSNNTLSKNQIVANSNGILQQYSSNNTVLANSLTANSVGIQLYESSSNQFYHNNMNNTKQTETYNSTNIWDYGYPSGGNYWVDYVGVDANHDGIGDTAYIIDSNNQDRFPLVYQWPDLTSPTTSHNYDGLWHTADFSITLIATDVGSGVAKTCYRVNDGLTKTVELDGQPGITIENSNNTLEYWSIDAVGNVESPYKSLTNIKLDKTAPTGSVSVNNGAIHTTSETAALSLTSTDTTSGVYQIRLSNDGIWDTELWETPVYAKEWNLTSGDGLKTVYYQIKDVAGLTSTTYSDTISLDTSPPQGSIQVNNGAAYTNTTTVNLALSATDTVSGVAQMRFSNDIVTWSDWETYSSSKSWTLQNGDGAKSVIVQYSNNAGLVSSYNSSIILDTTAPVANAGQSQTVTQGASVTFSASSSTDNIGIVSYVWDFGDGSHGSGMTTTHTYSSAGTYTARLTVQDPAGNAAAAIVTIVVQAPQPTPSPSPSPSPSPPSSPTPSPTPTASPLPSLSPSPTQPPSPSPSPQLPEERPLILYAVAVAVAFAVIGSAAFMLRRIRRH
jgi:parallel beta-helix repeat protein